MLKVFGLVAVIALTAAALPASPAAAVCSVFDRHPCAPTVCSVFKRGPCTPEFDPPLGQNLRVTIESTTVSDGAGGAHDQDNAGAERKVNTIRELFDALRACWVPPPAAEARHGMQMTVSLSFKRSGEIIAPPRVTYTTPDASREVRDAYHQAIMAALERCTPMPFTNGMGGAVAGRPVAIRYVDNRTLQSENP